MFLRQEAKKIFFVFLLIVSFPFFYYCGTLLSRVWIDMETCAVELFCEMKSFVSDIILKSKNHQELIQKINQADKKIANLEKKITQQNDEMHHLKKITDYLKIQEDFIRITAKVLRIDKYRGKNSFLISISNGQSVEPYDLVLSEGILVGRIIQCGFRGAYAMSITDPHFRIPVVFKESQIHAIICGNNSENLAVVHTNNIKSRIIEGEEVLTSGADGFTLPGISVGHIVTNQKGQICVKIIKKTPNYVTILKNAQAFF
jgi:cell shape-determining protein MreC